MIRLNEAQFRKVKRLTRSLCANNDKGCCLLLDDGEPCVCVQSISYSLLCRYFREAVLPADRELCADIMEQRDTRKRCELCGKPYACCCGISILTTTTANNPLSAKRKQNFFKKTRPANVYIHPIEKNSQIMLYYVAY